MLKQAMIPGVKPPKPPKSKYICPECDKMSDLSRAYHHCAAWEDDDKTEDGAWCSVCNCEMTSAVIIKVDDSPSFAYFCKKCFKPAQELELDLNISVYREENGDWVADGYANGKAFRCWHNDGKRFDYEMTFVLGDFSVKLDYITTAPTKERVHAYAEMYARIALAFGFDKKASKNDR